MFIAELAEDKKAVDVKIIDVKKVSSLTDFLVICTGESSPQINAVFWHIEETLKDRGEKLIRREGKPQSNWMILDLGKVIVHIMGVEERARYDLDGLWEKKAIVYHL